MADDTSTNRFAPPAAHVADAEAAAQGAGTLAPRSSRFWAAMIDVAVAIGAALLLSAVAPFPVFGNPNAGMWSLSVMPALIGFGLFLLLQGYLLTQRGQTIGKAVLKLRIVRTDGSPADAVRILGLRYGIASALNIIPALGMIYGIVDVLMIFRADRRCLHDHIAGTIVVKA